MVEEVDLKKFAKLHPDGSSGIDVETILKEVSGNEDRILPIISIEPPTHFTADPGDLEADSESLEDPEITVTVGKRRVGYQSRQNKPVKSSWSRVFRLG